MLSPSPRPHHRTPIAVFFVLLISYAYVWQARDWNSASRLMLTYALVDRGTLSLDGLERQTGDIAKLAGHYYTDKLPGFSLLAIPPYWLAKWWLTPGGHPLNRPGFAYWAPDYWVTLATSGLTTALAGALLASLARDLGCGPRRSALVGLAYGLATPAYAYATQSYGHQPSAFALLASFALLWRGPGSHPRWRAAAAGFLAAYAAIIELQVGPVSAILGFSLLAQVVGRRWPVRALGAFALGAAAPTLVLLGYNELTFGSPWDMGYFHLPSPLFGPIHSRANPLGLRRPDWSKAVPLLWGGYRGLFFYAPITVLAIPGWVVLARRRLWGMALVSAFVVAAIFVVNLSYPAWDGGWTTGPRLLVPLLPFAMLPVAALLAVTPRPVAIFAAGLGLLGGVLMLLFVGIGARVPQFVSYPLKEVMDLWLGTADVGWAYGQRFARNWASMTVSPVLNRLPRIWQGVQFLPLAAFQAVAIGLLMRPVRQASSREGSSPRPG